MNDAELVAREVEIPRTGVTVHDVTFDEAVELIVRWAREGSGGYVSTPNVDHLVRAHREPAFQALVKAARLRLPDGMGLIYGMRLRGRRLIGAVHGRLLPEAIVRATAGDSPAIAMIGGRDDAPERATERLRSLGGNVVAAVNPPMGFEIGGPADQEATRALVAADPRVLIVGFGAPKQERWMARHAAEFPHTVMLGLGQTIDVLGGRVPTAPAWMTRVGLEWAFRMLRDPVRIGRRVFLDDPPFFLWMLRARMRR
ncbi:MAG: N-acetylglucosaminyldiphosphoundecaprenol N-acetyl-beta-D-mannosaminyltransferase [Chloroflexota bacterium]|jgi:N-acetylglucosaminyldiphosphoundecaprenol N-acetyl-beta-D-mannosaminyltransferase|nr:N-acetylglucosaminyldiphosphoundecaprenol N-acetyl-beta-D-mannosaminyltransferase [Chloroflexota bacterium]